MSKELELNTIIAVFIIMRIINTANFSMKKLTSLFNESKMYSKIIIII